MRVTATIPRKTGSPNTLWLRWRGARGNTLRHYSTPWSLLHRFCILPVLDFLHSNFALDKLVHVSDDYRSLYVHEGERGRRVTMYSNAKIHDSIRGCEIGFGSKVLLRRIEIFTVVGKPKGESVAGAYAAGEYDNGIEGRIIQGRESAAKSSVCESMHATNPLTAPIHAPDADPGFTKKWLSYSTAWKL